MDNLTIYNQYKAVPKNAKKTIVAGRIKGFTDINPMWRIKSLTEAFGICGVGWYYKVTNKWLEAAEKQVIAFVDIELYVKVDEEWSMPIYGNGGSKFVSQESAGAYVSDECYKMATTDALSVACKQLGIGADVYWDADATKYTDQNEQPRDAAEEHDRLVGIFHQEVKRTGKSLRFFLNEAKVADAKELNSLTLTKFIDRLKQFDTKSGG